MKYLLFVSMILLGQYVIGQKSMHDVCPLKIGSEVPDVSLIDQNNQEQSLKSLINEKPSVLIFYRGAWCGYCTKHLAELNDIKSDIESLGFQILGITVDQSDKLSESNEKSSSEIVVYSDSDLEAISAFGLDWNVGDETVVKYKNEYKIDLEAWSGQDHHSLPVPAIYVIKDNQVEFQYVNPKYSTRLKAETLLSVLSTM